MTRLIYAYETQAPEEAEEEIPEVPGEEDEGEPGDEESPGLPVSVAEQKAHMHIDSDDENETIEAMLYAATEYCEKYQARAYTTKYYEGQIRCLELGSVYLFTVNPVTEITKIEARVDDDTVYSITDYIFDGRSGRLIIKSLPDGVDMSELDVLTPAIITFSAGHTETNPPPKTAMHAIKLIAAHWYEHREAAADGLKAEKVPFAFQALLDKGRIYI